MYILIKILQITLLLFTSLTLAILPWVPSLLVENIVNFTSVGLFIISGYLVYLIMKRLYDIPKKRNVYLSTGYTLLLVSYIGLFAIAQIGVSFAHGKYAKTYIFESLTFYNYELDDGAIEISVKDAYLPIRSVPIATFSIKPITLKKEGIYLYVIGKNLHEKVYDFKNNMMIKTINEKEKND